MRSAELLLLLALLLCLSTVVLLVHALRRRLDRDATPEVNATLFAFAEDVRAMAGASAGIPLHQVVQMLRARLARPLFPLARPVSWWQEPIEDDPAEPHRSEATSAGRPRRCTDPTTAYFADSPTTDLPSLGHDEEEPTGRWNSLMGVVLPVFDEEAQGLLEHARKTGHGHA